MKDSLFDLLSLASSTKFKILDAVELMKVLFTFYLQYSRNIYTTRYDRISKMLHLWEHFLLLVLSYLNLNYLQLLLRQVEFFSPGLTITTSPTAIVEGFTTMDSPFLKTLAVSGRMSIRSEMESRVLSSA